MNDDEKAAHKKRLACLRTIKSNKTRGVKMMQVLPDTLAAINQYKQIEKLKTQDAAIKKLFVESGNGRLLGIDEHA